MPHCLVCLFLMSLLHLCLCWYRLCRSVPMSLEDLVLLPKCLYLCLSVFFCVSVCVADRQGGQWVVVAVHRATTMNLYCGITDPARSLTMGNELLRPGADPLPFERRVETDDTRLQFLTLTATTSYNSFKPRSVTTCYNNAQIWHFGYIC